MRLPLFFIIGLRSQRASRAGATTDTCPTFALPIVNTWKVPYRLLTPESEPVELADAYLHARRKNEPMIVCLEE